MKDIIKHLKLRKERDRNRRELMISKMKARVISNRFPNKNNHHPSWQKYTCNILPRKHLRFCAVARTPIGVLCSLMILMLFCVIRWTHPSIVTISMLLLFYLSFRFLEKWHKSVVKIPIKYFFNVGPLFVSNRQTDKFFDTIYRDIDLTSLCVLLI